ncbi:DUF309 domain-containing protein [Bacillus sp. M6-12]|uniref:DUF309 domain-containing protein n=1 Tax=Bacillus sp. M6-12 TaxID=2054166 RepID=UPI000C769ADC|nr:DUF309 domain-containing protein [Bacillus sp. M6-12]PLS15673.1 DUF309 domain-containing protein [Bacillus sp. M6-12]
MEEYPIEYYTFFISFNEGDYYTCHDLLEEMWMTDKGNLFLKGLLQLSVAIYHYEYGNVKGARAMLEAARRYLTPYSPVHWGLQLEPVLSYIEYAQILLPSLDQVPFNEIGTLPKLPSIYLNIEV